MARRYRFGLKDALSSIEDSTTEELKYEFATSRIKSFIRGANSTLQRRQATQVASNNLEAIFAEFEAVYDVLGEKDETTSSGLEDNVVDRVTNIIREGIRREVGEMIEQSNLVTSDSGSEFEYKPGELNFFRQINMADITRAITEDEVLAEYGSNQIDCNCINKTRSDYSKCIPKDETVHSNCPSGPIKLNPNVTDQNCSCAMWSQWSSCDASVASNQPVLMTRTCLPASDIWISKNFEIDKNNCQGNATQSCPTTSTDIVTTTTTGNAENEVNLIDFLSGPTPASKGNVQLKFNWLRLYFRLQR